MHAKLIYTAALVMGIMVGAPQGATAATTDPTGGSGSHNNIMPSLVMTPLVTTVGQFPSQPTPPHELQISELRFFAGDFGLGALTKAEGQVLSILPSNTALFSVVGTTYGGDGTSTLGLPDLRGRVIVGSEQGPGLSPRPIGQ